MSPARDPYQDGLAHGRVQGALACVVRILELAVAATDIEERQSLRAAAAELQAIGAAYEDAVKCAPHEAQS